MGIPPAKPYTQQLTKVEQFVGRQPSEVEVVNVLGTDVSAIYSVPTAIHCFLRGQSPIPGIISDNPFRRSLEYAISLGGDTDTIASMTGAITGAFYGDTVIPENLRRHCEGNEEFAELAEQLYAVAEEAAAETLTAADATNVVTGPSTTTTQKIE